MNTNTRTKTRSPLKRKPLRNPGESIQIEMERLLEEKLIPILGI
jgi:hypothetical protein